MNFKKWVKSIQTAGYNGARTVFITICCNALTEPSEDLKIWGGTVVLKGNFRRIGKQDTTAEKRSDVLFSYSSVR